MGIYGIVKWKICTCTYISVCSKLVWINNSKVKLKFKGSCLKQEDKSTFTPSIVVNLFLVYELDTWSRDLNTDFTLKKCLFRILKLTKNVDPDKHKLGCNRIRFTSSSQFLFSYGRTVEWVKISLFFIYLFLFIYNHFFCWSTMLAVTNKNQGQ